MKAVGFILVILVAFLLLLGIIGLAALWFGGGKIVLLPGVGIAIATPLLIGLFIAVELILIVSAFLLWRVI